MQILQETDAKEEFLNLAGILLEETPMRANGEVAGRGWVSNQIKI